MSDYYLPTQPPGPGPTDAPLPTYQSYSAYTTSVYTYTTAITRVAYDPQGTRAPSLDIQTQTLATTSIGYSVVNIPLLYDGPLPPPPLGTLYTTANQRIAPTQTTTSGAQPTSGAGNGGGTSGNGSGQGSGNGGNNGGSSGTGSGSGSNGQGSGGTSDGGSNNNGNNGGNNNGGSNNGGTNGGGTGNGGSSNGGNTGSGQQQGAGNNGGTGMAGGDQGGNNNGGTGAGSGGQQGGGAGSGGSNNGGSNGGDTGTGGGNTTVGGGGALPTTATAAPPSGPTPTGAAAALSSSASAASVAASSAAASASLASAAASNAAESSSASLASQSAAAAASSASQASVSASSISASNNGGVAQPTNTNNGTGGVPTTSNFARNGLSGGQIAGIVVGTVLAALLALLLCLLCARRRRRRRRREASMEGGAGAGGGMRSRASKRWGKGWSRNAPRGDYASLGKGGAGAGLAVGGAAAGAAARGGRGSVRSEEWEEDRLSGGDGSGFFVVGGKRIGGDQGGASGDKNNPFSDDGDEMREYGNVAPVSASRQSLPMHATPNGGGGGGKAGLGAAAGLAGLGAGLMAAIGVKRRRSSSGKGKERDHARIATSADEADFADDAGATTAADRHGHDGDAHDDAERRGLMEFADADMTGDMSEVRHTTPPGWTSSAEAYSSPVRSAGGRRGDLSAGTAAGLGAVAGAAGAYAAGGRHRRGDSKHEQGSDAGAVAASSTTGQEMESVVSGAPASVAVSSSAIGATQPSATESSAGSGVASAYGSAMGSGPNASSNSTGQRTSDSAYTQGGAIPSILAPPPMAPRGERPMYSSSAVEYGNLAPSQWLTRGGAGDSNGEAAKARIPSFVGGFGEGDLGLQHQLHEDDEDNDERRLALAAAAATVAAGSGLGLSAMAAHHRLSAAQSDNGSSNGAAQNGNGNGDERYSRFISRDTPLLGPGAPHNEAVEKLDGRQYREGDSLSPHGRLPTIKSVGEFGERASGSIHPSVSAGSTSGYGSGRAPSSINPYQTASGAVAVSSQTLGAVTASEGGEADPFEDTQEKQVAPAASEEGHEGSAAAAGAGLFGSLAMGWRKLTGTTAGGDTSHDLADGGGGGGGGGDTTVDGGDGARHREPRARQRMLDDPSMAADVQSQRASVLDHKHNSLAGHDDDPHSRDQSGSSGDGSGNGNGHGLRDDIVREVEEPVAEDATFATAVGREHVASPYVDDDGNEADDEDAAVGAGAVAAAAAAASTALGPPSGDTSMMAHSRSHSQSQDSSGQQQRLQPSSSSVSTGAASYAPSSMAQHAAEGGSARGTSGGMTSSGSMSSRGARGGGGYTTGSSGSQRRRREGASTLDSDGRSSRATAGGESRRPWTLDMGGNGGGGGGGVLGQVHENRDQEFEDDDSELGEIRYVDYNSAPTMTPAPAFDESGEGSAQFYPSESLGAAVRRRAEQEAQQERARTDSNVTAGSLQQGGTQQTPRAIPMSLRAGGGMAASTSADDGSGQWRQSPRVQSVSRRAARAAAGIESGGGGSGSGGSQPGTPSHSRIRAAEEGTIVQPGGGGDTSYDPLAASTGAQAGDDDEQANRRKAWPKFLRF